VNGVEKITQRVWNFTIVILAQKRKLSALSLMVEPASTGSKEKSRSAQSSVPTATRNFTGRLSTMSVTEDNSAVHWAMEHFAWSAPRAIHAVEWMNKNVSTWRDYTEMWEFMHDISSDWFYKQFVTFN